VECKSFKRRYRGSWKETKFMVIMIIVIMVIAIRVIKRMYYRVHPFKVICHSRKKTVNSLIAVPAGRKEMTAE
jgi:hypothetical protein